MGVNDKKDAAGYNPADHPAHNMGDSPYDWKKDPGSGYMDPVKVDPSLAVPKPRKKRRVFLWFFLAVQAIFIIWIITGVAGNASTPADTGGVLTQSDANSARDAGTAIGVFMLFVFWAIVDFILGVGYAIKLLATRNR